MHLPPFKFYGEVTKDCRIRMFNAARYHQAIKMFAGNKVIWTIQTGGETRTSKQNSYYWVYLQIISSDTGEDENDLHDLFKHSFLPPTEKEVLGKKVLSAPSTTNLTTVEFNRYLANIEQMTGIPQPDRGLFYGEEYPESSETRRNDGIQGMKQ